MSKEGAPTPQNTPLFRALWWACIAVLAGVLVPSLVTAQHGAAVGIPGDYCRFRRPSECCDGRYDDCSVPILGTLCYCDHFCNRTQNPDCCPDYWEVCLGVKPPTPAPIRTCFKDGIYIPSGKSYKFNCNACQCNNGVLQCEDDLCMVDVELMTQVNLRPRDNGWRANNYSDYWGKKTKEGFIYRTGTTYPETLALRMYPINLRPDVSQIPAEFDARAKREWRGHISGVRDQGWCGSSWAFSSVGVAQDRLSIESSRPEGLSLSTQQLLSCLRRGQQGCQGGHVDRAWQYLRRTGLVDDDCMPYQSGSSGQLPACKVPRAAKVFSLQCGANEMSFHKADLFRTEPPYRIAGREEDIQWEIMRNGPVQAIMRVYRDLFMYSGGVYKHLGSANEEYASHSVRLLGWGQDSSLGGRPVKYWLAANSWGTNWGEQGFFRIRRGVNESEIESFILAVRAREGTFSERARRQRHILHPHHRRRGGHHRSHNNQVNHHQTHNTHQKNHKSHHQKSNQGSWFY